MTLTLERPATDLATATQIVKVVAYKATSQLTVARIEALRKLVKRHGHQVEVISIEEGVAPHPVFGGPERPKGRTVPTLTYSVQIPAVAGEKTKLIGEFELAEDGVQVYHKAVPPYAGSDLSPFAHRWNDCDHCGVKRARHASFLCERADGTRILVGRQCSQAFLGLSAADLLARAELLRQISVADSDEDCWSSGALDQYNTASLVENCYRVAQYFGGYSRAVREEMEVAVSAFYSRTLNAEQARIKDEIEAANYPAIDLDALEAFVDKKGRENDFFHDFGVAISCASVKYKRRALILAGVGTFVGNEARSRKQAADKAALESKLGPAILVPASVGQRVEFTAVVVRTSPYSNDFGGGLVIVLRGDNGCNAVHFCSGENTPSAGDRVLVRGTVKKHGADNRSGDPQTILSRCIYKEAP